jgi:hypothetical protein
VWAAVAVVASPKVPSPSRSQDQDAIVSPASGSLDPLPSKLTARGTGPLVGLALTLATGAWLPPV